MSSKGTNVTKAKKGSISRPEPLLTLRAAVILMAALVASGVTGILTYLASASLPEAYIAAGSACVAVITLLNAIIG